MVATTVENSINDGTDRQELESAVIRFAGDSGDGMQLTGTQFAITAALTGHGLGTFPDFPAEIRAPVGTTFGVSAFQVNFSSHNIKTAGDQPDVLMAMNPAALKTNINDLHDGSLVIINTGAFTATNLRKAGYEVNPLEDNTLAKLRVLEIDITGLTLQSLEGSEISNKDKLRCKNLYALGVVFWMFGGDSKPTAEWLTQKFGGTALADANITALNAGYTYGEVVELPDGVRGYAVSRNEEMEAGTYRAATGSETLTWGLVVGAQKADLPLFFGGYPITPASNILHSLAGMKEFGVVTFQAEDEIAAICSSIGASYAGALGVTSSSGPGIALKGEALGLAASVELPLVVVNTQRGGPATGLPTKTEQSDLMQAMYGRNGDCPIAIISASTPGDCYETAIEACRLAVKYMTPVMLLSDGYIANAAEPWKIPDTDDTTDFPTEFHTDTKDFAPYSRDPATLARPWAIPGTPGLEHRISGLERDALAGTISYDPENHQAMTDVRAAKIDNIDKDIPEQTVSQGAPGSKLALVGWGSTYGAISQGVTKARAAGLDVSHIHIRYLNPFPANLGELLASYDQILVPEMNTGQLIHILRSKYMLPAIGYNQVNGLPIKVSKIEEIIRAQLES